MGLLNDPIAPLDLKDLVDLPPPALSIWELPVLDRFYISHQALKHDMLNEPKYGVCQIRFKNHCKQIPKILRELHNIDDVNEFDSRHDLNPMCQFLTCQRIDDLLNVAIAFWGCEYKPGVGLQS